MKEEKYVRRWHWNRERDHDDLVRQKMAKGLPVAEAVALVRPCTRRIKTVNTRFYWWRAANRFALHFDIDGAEPSYNFWFVIPWLFGISIELECNRDWFKRKYPDLLKTNSSKTWGLTLNRTYGAFEWASCVDNFASSEKRTGIYKLWDWVNVLKGENTDVTWSKAELVLEKDIQLQVICKSKLHPNVPYAQTTRVQVYRKVGTWHFSRWFPKKYTRWEVECDQVFIMPGKGENSWDQDSWEWGGYNFDAKRQSCNFSCGGKDAWAAVERFKEAFTRYQKQG